MGIVATILNSRYLRSKETSKTAYIAVEDGYQSSGELPRRIIDALD